MVRGVRGQGSGVREKRRGQGLGVREKRRGQGEEKGLGGRGWGLGHESQESPPPIRGETFTLVPDP